MTLSSIRSMPSGGRLTVALVTTALALTACGGSSNGGSKNTGDNAALGTKQVASGTPVKVGYISDGSTAGITATHEIDTVKAAVKYVNDYLNGIGGHPLELDFCETKQTPAGAAACVSQLAKDKVAYAINGQTGQAAALFTPLTKAGISLFVASAVDPSAFADPDIDVLVNGLSSLAAPAKIAKDAGVTRSAFVVIDVPAASGPIKSLAQLFYGKAGIPTDIVTIPPGTPDVTPQITAELQKKPGQIVIVADKSLNITTLKALAAANYKGQIFVTAGQIPAADAATLTNIEGARITTTFSTDPNSAEYKLYNAVLDTYGPSEKYDRNISVLGYQAIVAFARATAALTGQADKKSIAAAIHSAPTLPFPLMDGITFQCNKAQASKNIAPNFCSTDLLQATLDKNGIGVKFEPIKVDGLF